MEFLAQFIDIFLHIDKYLDVIIKDFGVWKYVILFVVLFCETGLVVTPLLPGDSLLFAAGAFAAIGSFNPWILLVTLSIAAIAGDTVNYWIGYFVGPKIFHKENVRFLKKEYLMRTHEFYERYGGKTIFLARFIPIIRTFAPFVAGIGRMTYWHFISYNILGGIIWPILCIFSGYYFGNMPIVKEYFSLVLLAIVFISVLPIIVEMLRMRLQTRKANNI